MYGSCSLCEWNSITHLDFLSPVSSTWCYYCGIHTSLPQCLYQFFNFFLNVDHSPGGYILSFLSVYLLMSFGLFLFGVTYK